MLRAGNISRQSPLFEDIGTEIEKQKKYITIWTKPRPQDFRTGFKPYRKTALTYFVEIRRPTLLNNFLMSSSYIGGKIHEINIVVFGKTIVI